MRLRLTPQEMREISALLELDPGIARAKLESLSHPELAELLLVLRPPGLAALESIIGSERLADVMAHLEPGEAARLLVRFSKPYAADVLEDMGPDDATDVVEEMEESQAEGILAEMDSAEAAEIRELMTYPPDTAGGHMTPEFITIPPDATVASALRQIRAQAAEAETVFYTYVTDHDGRLVGVISLRALVLAEPQQFVSEIMHRHVISVPATTGQEEAARVAMVHDYLALPIVDDEGRLLGIITGDDMADVARQEATEDMYRMAGVGVKERATSPMLESARRRVPWLGFNMLWSLGSAVIISIFQPTIEAAAVIAIFIPVITGQAGNAGIQTATIVIRSLALGEVSPRDTMRVLAREWGVGLIKGGIFGLLLGLIAFFWKGSAALGVIAGGALFLNIAVVASTTGVLFPMTLRRLGVDPATIAGVFDTMLSDLMGNLIYLGLATLFLRYLVGVGE